MSSEEQVNSSMVKKELKYKNTSEQIRVVRGYAIISKGDVPRKIGKETFIVPSQNDNGEYTVSKNGRWECTCPDFAER